MQLGDRKKKILQAVVQDYIITAEPVGSRSISKKYIQDLSSATIRNEMADLEDMGYLEQPHTSAGRIPTDLGYRIFVDNMLEKYKLTLAEMLQMREAINMKIKEANKIASDISSVLSQLTDYAAVATTRSIGNCKISAASLMYVDDFKLVAILVLSDGNVKNRLIVSSVPFSQQAVANLSDLLGKGLTGLSVNAVETVDYIKLAQLTQINTETVEEIFSFIISAMHETEKSNITVDGSINLLKLPEYSDINKAKQILEFMHNKENLNSLSALEKNENGISVFIGHENPLEEFKDCSVIMCSYSLPETSGSICLVGPRRMDYSKTVSMLEYLKNELGRLLE